MPFSDLYHSIKHVYHEKQNRWEKRKQKMTVYRGAEFSDKEKKQFSQNRNHFIQFEGFLSTSLLEAVAQMFPHNTMIEI